MTLADRSFSIDQNTIHVFKTGRWKQNSYVIYNHGRGQVYVIDPGGEAEKIISDIQAFNAPLGGICLTHAHHDHVGALKVVCGAFQSNFHIHSNDLKLLKRAPLFAVTFESRKMEIPQFGYTFMPSEKKGWLSDSIKFIHTPGHTTGGVVIVIDNLAFTGDTLLNRMVGRTDLPGACAHELDSSISYFLNELPSGTTLFPGHGEPWKVEEAQKWWEENRYNLPEYRKEDNELGY